MAYKDAVIALSARFEGLEFHHVQRDSNQAADVLARMGARREPVPQNTFLERLFKPSVKWQGDAEQDAKKAEESAPELITPPDIEPDEEIIGGSALEETPSAHEIMAVIAPGPSQSLHT